MPLFRFRHVKTGGKEGEGEPSTLLYKHNRRAFVIHGLFFVAVIVFFLFYSFSDIDFFKNVFAKVIPLYYSSEKWVEFKKIGSDNGDELLKALNKSLSFKAKKGCAFPDLEQTEDNATTLMFVLTLVYTSFACLHHGACMKFTKEYNKQLETGIVWWRYAEYAFSGSSMYVIILISAGYGDVHTLLLGFVAFALLQISGLCTDALIATDDMARHDETVAISNGRKIAYFVILIGFVCFGALMYLPIHTLADNWYSNMPISIYALFTLEVTLFTGFGLVQLQRVVGQIGDDLKWYEYTWAGTVVILLFACFTIVALEIHDRKSVQNNKGLCVGFLIGSYFLFVFFGLYPILKYWCTALFRFFTNWLYKQEIECWDDPSVNDVIVPTEERFIYLSLFSKTLLTIILKMFVFTVGHLRSKFKDWTFGDTPLECFETGH